MYIVTVTFEIKPQFIDNFTEAIKNQAQNSIQIEPGCEQFDVAFASEHPSCCFLYEVYRDRGAFDAHLQSTHFKAFERTIADWVESKSVATYERVTSPRA